MNSATWTKVNQDLIAKAIGELTFEEILFPVELRPSTPKLFSYELKLKDGVLYTFEGWMSLWNHLKIFPETLRRNSEKALDAGQFFIDSQTETGMDAIVLANFLEEMHNTLFSDLTLYQKNHNLKAQDLAQWKGEKIQTVLNGHPKILLNKGRMGWAVSDLEAFSPESAEKFQLHWLGVKRSLIKGLPIASDFLLECFTEDALGVFLKEAAARGVNEEYTYLPVHPWQWDRFIQPQFAGLINQGAIVSLGLSGDYYLPQISIRTLSNVSRPAQVDIKLPLSILNTSCIRGLPAQAISIGPKVSGILDTICKNDDFLKASQTEVLVEKAGIALLHPLYSQIENAPYRYHEYLGAVWRESSESKVKDDEIAIISASLFYQDKANNSLIGEYVKISGLTVQEWLKAYFRVIVLPLYHLQLKYGVGMVAHGQNIILKLKKGTPSGMILKDFQGDLRLSTELPEEGRHYFRDVSSELTKLPPHYLIHDLITGHFVTVLRFISEVLYESQDFKEQEFYSILSEVLEDFMKERKIPDSQNLLAKTFPRVLLNKVRFAIGYSDSAERPLPMVGSDLLNPICP